MGVTDEGAVIPTEDTGGIGTVDLVRCLSPLRLADDGLAGGKGANLGELTAAGFPVPDGYVAPGAGSVAR
ncbi:MAG: Pyruvate phosphate dikinase, PEP/pyruvate binding domain [Blastococcus sp.]|jgi:hypothetical protein|nr:Pyruvate phosphate dikinase, PEP/pyruvate binding domain [Blastococcus sp.]